MSETVLSINNLKTYFSTKDGLARAVDGVSYDLRKGRTLGLVGESGCGKTVSSLSIIRLLDMPPAQFHGGTILFEGQDLLKISGDKLRAIRGRKISMIFQEPMTSLNPLLTIGLQVDEVLMNHWKITAKKARERTIELLNMVGIPSPKKRAGEFPHQLSGGMRQRIMIALALACDPQVLIADEPTTALDVTIQAQILDLMGSLQEKLGTSILMITHDLGVIAETAHRVAVMYAGKIVEKGEVADIFKNPIHPYTRGLMNSMPRVDVQRTGKSGRLAEIPGLVPNLCFLPKGCAFYDRCPIHEDQCIQTQPELKEAEPGHVVSCLVKTGK